jgi:hypothetical protein
VFTSRKGLITTAGFVVLKTRFVAISLRCVEEGELVESVIPVLHMVERIRTVRFGKIFE